MKDTSDGAGRAWARSKLDWLDRVADDLDSGDHLAFRVAHALARVADKDSGIADRSQADLAKRVKVTTRSLQSAIEKLEARGHLTVIRANNPKLGNRYRPTFQGDISHAQSVSHESIPHAQAASHETHVFHAQCASYENDPHAKSHTKNSTVSYEASFVPIPGIDPRRSPQQPPSSVTVMARATTTEAEAGEAAPLSNDELWDELRNAAAGNIVDGPGTRDLQPIRALIAEGVNLERIILPVISSRVVMLSDPLRTWRAPWLLDAIGAVARGVPQAGATIAPTARPVEATAPSEPLRLVEPAPPTARPAPKRESARACLWRPSASFGDDDGQSAEEVHRVGDRIISASDLRLTVNGFYEHGRWPGDLGPPPCALGCLLPAMTSAWSPPLGEHPMVRLPGQMPRSDQTVWSLVRLYRDGGMPWPEFFGTEPGTPGCLLPQRFQDGALVNRKPGGGSDA